MISEILNTIRISRRSKLNIKISFHTGDASACQHKKYIFAKNAMSF